MKEGIYMTALENANKKYNVVQLNNNSVYNVIQLFLDRKAEDSIKTSKNYRTAIIEFFSVVFGKDLSQLTWDDLKNREKLNYTNIQSYQMNYLKKKEVLQKDNTLKEMSNSSVNARMSALRSLFNEFHKTDNDINNSIFDVNTLKVEPKEYEWLSEEQCYDLFNFALQENMGLIKSLFFKTLYVTGLRKEATLNNLHWKNIKRELDSESGIEVWILRVKDKGSKYDKIAISDDFYNELCQLKNDDTTLQDRVFQISERPLYDCFDKFCKYANIDRDNYNYGIHSIKKATVTMSYIRSGRDIKIAQEHGHHANASTTENHYLESNKSFIKQMSYSMDKKIDFSVFETWSREELLEAVMNSSYVAKMEVLNNKVNNKK